jgi:DNA-binding MarR family transcriptional regulator
MVVPKSTLTRSDLELASTLRMSVARLARRLRGQRSDLSLTLTQLAALATLERHGAMTPRELAEHEKVQPPSMTRVLAVLEERGLVDRTPHPTDGRQQLVTVTKDAKAMLRDDRKRRDAWLARRLGELSPAERDVLRAAAPVLERLAQA